jgi:hypothetical protein
MNEMTPEWPQARKWVAEVDIPLIAIRYDPDAHDSWRNAQKQWQASGRTEYRAFGRFAELARRGRLRLPNDGHASYRFVEFETALQLESAGFTCWGGVQLFKYGNKNFDPEKWAARQTAEVKGHWPSAWPYPAEVQDYLAFRPRNPDLVAFHPRRGEWRFCEVKGPNDRFDSEQLASLAVLHLLTGSPVAVVKLNETGAIKRDFLRAKIELKGGANPAWASVG